MIVPTLSWHPTTPRAALRLHFHKAILHGSTDGCHMFMDHWARINLPALGHSCCSGFPPPAAHLIVALRRSLRCAPYSEHRTGYSPEEVGLVYPLVPEMGFQVCPLGWYCVKLIHRSTHSAAQRMALTHQDQLDAQLVPTLYGPSAWFKTTLSAGNPASMNPGAQPSSPISDGALIPAFAESLSLVNMGNPAGLLMSSKSRC